MYYLDNNQIENIESLQFLKVNSLEQLSLTENNIIRCKAIRKTDLNLSLLNLSKRFVNKIVI